MSILGMELKLTDRVCFPGFYFQHRGRETGPERHPGLEYNSIVAEGFSGPKLSAA